MAHNDHVRRDGGGSSPWYVERPQPVGSAEVLDMILHKGMVIETSSHSMPIGAEILTVDGRIVIASGNTYLRLADAVARFVVQRMMRPRSSTARAVSRSVGRVAPR